MNTPLDHSQGHSPAMQHKSCRERVAAAGLSLVHSTTGFHALDRILPAGGWPLSALTEIHHKQPSIGELRLLMPALARLSRQGRWIAIIAPPFFPYAPALASFGLDLSRVLLVHPKSQHDALGALEQGLRSGTCGAVIAWPKQVDAEAMCRLQAAAKAGKTWGVLFREPSSGEQQSVAALRLRLEEREGDTVIHILNKQGAASDAELTLDLSRHASLQPAPKSNSSAAPRRNGATAPRFPGRPHFNPGRRQELPPQLELPLPLPSDKQPPLRQDKPGILSWRWRR